MFGFLDPYVAAFLTALVVTYLLTPLVRALACRFGVMDLPNERRPHKHPTARGGGLAVVLGVHAACVIMLFFPPSLPQGSFNLHWWVDFMLASLILLVVGLLDDIRGLRPLAKLGGQVAAALLICLSGTHFGPMFGITLSPFLDDCLVVLWIVAIINAFNLIDGLDGLASGLAIISATGLCGIIILGNLPGVPLVLVALVGACLAFLRYNFYPATIFLGDTGSMFIGFVLGVVSLQSFSKNTFFLSMTIPMLVLGVPIYDALLAVWRRAVRQVVGGGTINGVPQPKGIMAADLEHLHHRLLKAGLSTRRVATTLVAINAGLVVSGLLLTLFKSHASGIFLLALLAVAYVLLRRMAAIELRETGQMLLFGLRRPTHAMLKALVYPVWDVACLSAAVAVTMKLLEPAQPDFWHAWFLILPIWVTPTISLLAVSRTYLTLWTRARLLDVLMLVLDLSGGLAISLGIALLLDPSSPSLCLERMLIIGALGNGGILGSRIFYRCIEEVVLYLRTRSELTGDVERVVLYGAGGRCQLFLKERGFINSSSFGGRNIVGLIDDEPSLRSKWVYGHMVLGGARDLPRLIPHYRIGAIIVTTALSSEAQAAIKEIASRHHLRLSEWCLKEGELEPPRFQAAQQAQPTASIVDTSAIANRPIQIGGNSGSHAAA